MGLATVFQSMSTESITQAVKWVGDFAPLMIIFSSVSIVGLVLTIMRRFL